MGQYWSKLVDVCVFSESLPSLTLATYLCMLQAHLSKETPKYPNWGWKKWLKLPEALLIGARYGWVQSLTFCISPHTLSQSWQLFSPSEELIYYVLAAFWEKKGEKKKTNFQILHEATARNNPGFWKNSAGVGVEAPLISTALSHSYILPKLCAALGLKRFLYSKLL